MPSYFSHRARAVLGALSTLSQPLGIAVFGALMLHVTLSVMFPLIAVFVIIGGLLFIKPVSFPEVDEV